MNNQAQYKPFNTTRLNWLTAWYDLLLDNNYKLRRIDSDKYDRIVQYIASERRKEMRKQDATLDKSKYKVEFTREMMFNLTNPDFL